MLIHAVSIELGPNDSNGRIFELIANAFVVDAAIIGAIIGTPIKSPDCEIYPSVRTRISLLRSCLTAAHVSISA